MKKKVKKLPTIKHVSKLGKSKAKKSKAKPKVKKAKVKAKAKKVKAKPKAVKVKPVKIAKAKAPRVVRVPSGITNFDKLVEGGFEKNSINLIVGNSGTGKSIFGAQFLVEGMKRGEGCFYITFQEDKDEFYSNMREFGWDLAEYERKGKFTFLEYRPEKVKTMLEEGGGIIESIILRKKIKRIVIDSITSFEMLFESELQKREAALSLFTMLRKWETTAMLTYEGDLTKDKKALPSTLEFESDSLILLYFPRLQRERERYIEIFKMRGTDHSRKVYPFSISDKGAHKGVSIGKSPTSKKVGI